MAEAPERSRLPMNRALAICGLALVIFVALTTGLVLNWSRHNALADREHELHRVALAVTEQVDRTLQLIDLIQKDLSERAQLQHIVAGDQFEERMSGERIRLVLKYKVSDAPHIESIALYGTSGKLINFYGSTAAPPDISERRYFRRLSENPELMLVIGRPRQISGTWAVSLVHKVTGPNNEFLGLITTRLSLQFFVSYFEAMRPGEESFITLMRRDGIGLIRHPEKGIPGQSFSRMPMFDATLAQADSGGDPPGLISSADLQLASRNLPHYPLVVVVGAPRSTALAQWRIEALYMGGTSTLLAFIIGSLVQVASRRVKDYERTIKNAAETEQRMQLDAAINNMQQGLLLFDPENRLILFNQRFVHMYGLSPEALKPGLTLREILHLRKSAGTFSGDPDQYAGRFVGADGTFHGDPNPEITKRIDGGRAEIKVADLPDGRIISVTNQALPNGGWIATHRDITERRRVEEEHARNREFLNRLIESVPVPIFVKDAVSRRYLLTNRAAEQFWGLSNEAIIERTADEIFPEDAELIRKRDDETLLAGTSNYAEREMHTPGNGMRWASSRRLTIGDRSGRPTHLVGVLVDATERRRLEHERDRSEAFLRTLIDSVPVSILVKDAKELRYVWANRAAADLWGISRDQVIGKTAQNVFPPPMAETILMRDKEALERKHQIQESTHELQMPNRGTLQLRTKRIAIPGTDGNPEYLLTVVEDVTERARSEERIAHLAHHDVLTDLPNRLLFSKQLDQALARVHRGERIAVLYLDFDYFKHINDTLGHARGDDLLKAVAERLHSCIKDVDSIARLGGDEFAVVQTSIEDAAEAAVLAGRIRERIREPYDLGGHSVELDVSIGIAVAPNDGTERDEILKNADLALYAAKAAGRGTYRFFQPEMNERVKSRHELERDLRKALTAAEFELHYQPFVDIERNDVVAFEALLRWRHPQRGLISPSDFISVAEETGLIVPIGEWVLQTACTTAAAWPENIGIAINLSPSQLTRNLVQLVTEVLATSGLDGNRLELEITESVLMRNTESTLETLHELRKLGVRIAMDDFGIGYSSLSYLMSFPFDKIKIDRSFIEGVSDQRTPLAIVRAIINLAKNLGMTTIAEGVETREQLEMVKDLGCREIQGYLVGQPRPADALAWTLGNEVLAA